MQENNRKSFITRLLSLIIVVLILAAAAILREGRIFGHDINDAHAQHRPVVQNEEMSVRADGTVVVSTLNLAKDVQGYGGQVPLRISISPSGVITHIEAMPNSESPDFFAEAKKLFARWQGKDINTALTENVDAVSGATFSSKAIIENMRRGLVYAHQHAFATDDATSASAAANSSSAWQWGFSLAAAVALVVAVLGAIVPLYAHSRRWHYVQMALNVAVLGLWTGTFVSYAMFMRLFAGGISLATLGTLAAPLVMIVVALIYPLAGHGGHYCANICPFGSAQELAGQLTKRKLRPSARLNRRLMALRNVLWAVLMTLMLTGTWTAWMDYELFTAFVYSSASVWVIVAAVAFLVLSVWVPRPYCRFVCPTGMLIRI